MWGAERVPLEAEEGDFCFEFPFSLLSVLSLSLSRSLSTSLSRSVSSWTDDSVVGISNEKQLCRDCLKFLNKKRNKLRRGYILPLLKIKARRERNLKL